MQIERTDRTFDYPEELAMSYKPLEHPSDLTHLCHERLDAIAADANEARARFEQNPPRGPRCG
jgi:hypothetical protein